MGRLGYGACACVGDVAGIDATASLERKQGSVTFAF
jgi:hypothetical protein